MLQGQQHMYIYKQILEIQIDCLEQYLAYFMLYVPHPQAPPPTPSPHGLFYMLNLMRHENQANCLNPRPIITGLYRVH